jgi:carboxylate-amine ligase
MDWKFSGSRKPTIGVEIEVQIINPSNYDLFSKSHEILAFCKDAQIEGVKAEIHQSMLEIDTEICPDVKACFNSLKSRYKSLKQITQAKDCSIAVMGTHPFQKWSERLFTESKRYLAIQEKYQWLARRMNVYGMHVHIGVEDLKSTITLMNKLTRFLPHLLALSANSPFWQGIDTGMESCRLNILESFPNAGIPRFFQNEDGFCHYLETLISNKAIDTIKDLYWFFRPNFEYGTIEFRICDAILDLDETIALVALMQSLVVFCLENPNHPIFDAAEKSHWITPTNLFTAARDGLDSQIITLDQKKASISKEIENLILILEPIASSLDCKEELLYCRNIISNGTGAKRQRSLFLDTNNFNQLMQSFLI